MFFCVPRFLFLTNAHKSCFSINLIFQPQGALILSKENKLPKIMFMKLIYLRWGVKKNKYRGYKIILLFGIFWKYTLQAPQTPFELNWGGAKEFLQ